MYLYIVFFFFRILTCSHILCVSSSPTYQHLWPIWTQWVGGNSDMKRLSEFLFDIFNCYKSKSVAVLIISSTRLCCETHHMCVKDCQNVAISHCLHFVVEIIVWNVHFVFVCLIYFENVNTLLFLFLEVKLYS